MVDVLAELKTISALLRDRPVENIIKVAESASVEKPARNGLKLQKAIDYFNADSANSAQSNRQIAKLLNVDEKTVREGRKSHETNRTTG